MSGSKPRIPHVGKFRMQMHYPLRYDVYKNWLAGYLDVKRIQNLLCVQGGEYNLEDGPRLTVQVSQMYTERGLGFGEKHADR